MQIVCHQMYCCVLQTMDEGDVFKLRSIQKCDQLAVLVQMIRRLYTNASRRLI
jgi:hypothetical protein